MQSPPQKVRCNYTIFNLGNATLHQLHTSYGKVFTAAQVAIELFQEIPGKLIEELRKGKYSKFVSSELEILNTVQEIGIPIDSSTLGKRVTLLPTKSVEQLIQDKRRLEFLQPLRLAVLKLTSQEAALLMSQGQYEAALPLSITAVQLGQEIFKPGPTLQMFPLYLLAAQANLGLKRSIQCEQLLGLASWLAVRDSCDTTAVMRAQLSRLYGQLYMLTGDHENSLRAFSEDVYYNSIEFGPEDAHTSLGYYNMGKIFQAQEQTDQMLACWDMVAQIWQKLFVYYVLGVVVEGSAEQFPEQLPLGKAQVSEIVDMLEDIILSYETHLGQDHLQFADTVVVASLGHLHIGHTLKAKTKLQSVMPIFEKLDSSRLTQVQKALEVANQQALGNFAPA